MSDPTGLTDAVAMLSLWAATSVGPWLVVRREQRRLARRGEAHPWNAATTLCAAFVFGLFALPAHEWAMRRHRRAALALLAIPASLLALDALLQRLFG